MLPIGELKRKIRHLLPMPVTDLVLKLKYLHQEIDGHGVYADAVRGGKGLEVGGPSTLFKTTLPVYQAAQSLDGANFGAQTVWEGSLQHGTPFRYLGLRVGKQYIADATDLSPVDSGRYDFVLSSNCLEHVANPIRALLEWKRVLRDGGCLILVLPNKESNFDHRRPVTPVEHLLDDHRRGIGEDDLTHLPEILELHDLERDPPAGSREQFRLRGEDNLHNRTLHHHVFDVASMRQLLQEVGFEVLRTDTNATDHFALARKKPQ